MHHWLQREVAQLACPVKSTGAVAYARKVGGAVALP